MAKGKEAKRGKKEEKPVEAPKEEAKPEEAPKAEAAEEAPKEEKKKEKKEKKPQKERPRSKTKHKNIQIWKLYETKEGSLSRKNEPCPRCGAGTFLATFKERKYCGKCGWSQLPKKEEKK